MRCLRERLWMGVCLLLAAGGVHAQQPELRTVTFDSPAVQRTMKYNILLPAGYEATTARYPVLYLLHGVGSNYTAWGLENEAPFYAGLYGDLIVVMPDVGNTWYVNWAAAEGEASHNWETYIVEDVIGHVDTHFRTINQREGRAISGLSMGGYGAFMLGLRHPERFISIGSTSGYLGYARTAATSLRNPLSRTPRRRARSSKLTEGLAQYQHRADSTIGIPGFSSPHERTPRGRPFASLEQAEAHDPFKLVAQIPPDQLPHIYLDCGTDDTLRGFATEFAQVLLEKAIPFNYMQMSGQHDAAYWMQALGHMMPIQYEVMRRALGERPTAVAAHVQAPSSTH